MSAIACSRQPSWNLAGTGAKWVNATLTLVMSLSAILNCFFNTFDYSAREVRRTQRFP
jgi:hypothetical protein